MKSLLPLTIVTVLFLASCGTTSRVTDEPVPKTEKVEKGTKIEEGVASWYGPNFHGKLTANGETYDMNALTAAHRTLPFNTILKVNNLDNGQSVKVRINDRGPYAKNRIIDLSKKAAKEINMLGPGTARVELIMLEGNFEKAKATNLKVPTYSIQLASFESQHKALDYSRKLKGARVEKIKLNSKTVFRVYYGIYTDKSKARQKKEQLRRRGFNGYIKQLQN